MKLPTLPHKGETLAKCLSVVALIAQGRTPTRAMDESHIAFDTFNKYCGEHAELLQMYQEAIQRGHDVLADILLEIDTHTLYGTMNPAMAKVLSDNIKWYLAHKDPVRYGEKVTITHNITADKAITDALQAAKTRAFAVAAPPALPPPPADNIIDITPVHVRSEKLSDLY